MNYLREKIENLNGDLSILENNLDILECQPENIPRLKHVARTMAYIVSHLNLDLNDFSDEDKMYDY